MAQMAFGTDEFAGYIKSPLKSLNIRERGSSESRDLPDGSVSLYSAPMRHKEFDFQFSGTDWQMNLLLEYFKHGKHFLNNRRGPYFMLMPNSTNINLLPDHWASPGMAGGAGGQFAKTIPLPGTVTSADGARTNPYSYNGQGLYYIANIRMNNREPTGFRAGNLPHATILVPPNHGVRLTGWAARATVRSPTIRYQMSRIWNTGGFGSWTPPADYRGHLAFPVAPPVGFDKQSITVAPFGDHWSLFRVWLSNWPYTGTAPTYTPDDWTLFHALDARIARGSVPGAIGFPTAGEGHMPINLLDNTIEKVLEVSRPNGQSYYRVTLPMGEVALPW